MEKQVKEQSKRNERLEQMENLLKQQTKQQINVKKNNYKCEKNHEDIYEQEIKEFSKGQEQDENVDLG